MIEDEPDMRLVAEMMLSSDGHDVLLAEDGSSGLAAIREERPDAVFLDIRIPPPDGWDVLRAVKSDPDLASIRVVMVSAHSSDTTLKRARDEGSDGYLTKPFTRAELLKALVGDWD